MFALPLHLAMMVLIVVFGVWAAVLHLWMRKPEVVQDAVWRAFATIYRYTMMVCKIVLWPVTLLRSYLILLAMFPVYLAFTLVWVTLKKIVGEPAKVSIKLA